MPTRILTIALHEYVTNVRRKEFILMTLGLPVFMFFLFGISAVGAGAVVSEMLRHRVEKVGIVDESGQLGLDAHAVRSPSIELKQYSDVEEGKADIRSAKIAALIIAGKDYMNTGAVEVFRKGGGLFNRAETIPVGQILTRVVLTNTRMTPQVINRAVNPTGPGASVYTWNAKKREFSRRTGAGEAARFLVPYIFTMLLFTSIFISANYLLRGIADEKENRVIEVILSSVRPDELLKGKLIGLAAVGLTQVGLWMLISIAPASIAFSRVVHIAPATMVGVVVFFALGFGLYATLMAGIGSLGTSYRETQQISGSVSMLAIAPLLLMTVILEFPNGILARILSYIPFTAPTTMVLRITSAEVPLVDYAISALSIIIGIWLVLKLSAKLFRFGLLIYGKRPTFGETMRWLRQS